MAGRRMIVAVSLLTALFCFAEYPISPLSVRRYPQSRHRQRIRGSATYICFLGIPMIIAGDHEYALFVLRAQHTSFIDPATPSAIAIDVTGWCFSSRTLWICLVRLTCINSELPHRYCVCASAVFLVGPAE